MNAVADSSQSLLESLYQCSDQELNRRIQAARDQLGEKLVILCHHYQREEVYQFADLTGDSLKLSRLASQRTRAETIVFCGVHFMAEVADILSGPNQVTLLPDLAAGCSMADMADLLQVTAAWKELERVIPVESQVTPVTYVNSTAELKAFCGAHQGIVCTSSNATNILKWAFSQRPKVFFFPDQHLGRNSAKRMGIPLDEIVLYQPDLPLGGLTEDAIRKARVILWNGYCSVHQMFQPAHVELFRKRVPGIRIVVHPECSMEVCDLADELGSTEKIQQVVRSAPPGSRFAIGTELNLVNRLKHELPDREIHFLCPTICMCSTMFRIDTQHLCWTLEQLVQGRLVNRISVPQREAQLAKLALERMLSVS
ncbi:MAG: quinolinate synthase NadA [Magnetococcales bacterium]|nr:quinolinate synthase NadA [Magnetococcales bacterium]MBF0148887.1 quinolinate synthase NadA [Magnetococcales bacterium]MBF0172956.1 quinolinate synthase NadA [Magnetococcales bacterium]MBF0347335.1 quinolinate synthase NadA [Magnetococcales bacterium]MBF0630088.1 quinolinate synthase NadA [Magnetococcales bacterium]